MRAIGLMFLAFLGAAAPARAQQPETLARIAVRYVEAQEAVMQADAGAAEVEALLAFYADDYVYHHPRFGARIEGRDAHRRGIAAHLGETADADIEIVGILVNGDSVALAVREQARLADGSGRIDRRRMIVITFRGDRIVQRVDS